MTTDTVNLPPMPRRYTMIDQPADMVPDDSGQWVRLSDALSYGMAVQEACAKACEQVAADEEESSPHKNYDLVALDCAAAIRNGVIREGEGK